MLMSLSAISGRTFTSKSIGVIWYKGGDMTALMRPIPWPVVLASVILAHPLHADILRYKDGREIKVIIVEEEEKGVRVNVYGQEVVVPRSVIDSVRKEGAKENAALESRWKQSRQAPKDASPGAAPALRSAEIAPRPSPSLQGRTPLPEAFVPPHKTPTPTAALKKSMELLRRADARKAINEHKVLVGMSEREVRSAWGWPDQTHPVAGTDHKSDRWTFRRPGEGLVDLYFQDGVLTHVGK
jgi:hypothetical protein